jgi:hypothetical protein
MNICAAMTPPMANRQGSAYPPRHRIRLRYWGPVKYPTPALLRDLPDFEGRVAWTDDDGDADVHDLVVHLIDPSCLRAGQPEPAAAMRRAFRRGDKEIALVLGSAASLPQKRYGCWIVAGRRGAADALGVLARVLVHPALNPDSRHRWNLHNLADASVLCVLATEHADDREGLARQVIGAMSTALGLSHIPPARIIAATQAPVIATITSSYPMDRDRVQLVPHVGMMNPLTADILVAYPWPADLLK